MSYSTHSISYDFPIVYKEFCHLIGAGMFSGINIRVQRICELVVDILDVITLWIQHYQMYKIVLFYLERENNI